LLAQLLLLALRFFRSLSCALNLSLSGFTFARRIFLSRFGFGSCSLSLSLGRSALRFGASSPFGFETRLFFSLCLLFGRLFRGSFRLSLAFCRLTSFFRKPRLLLTLERDQPCVFGGLYGATSCR